MWDLRSEKCCGEMKTPGIPCVEFDHQGLVFAVSSEAGIIKLFDLKDYTKGPFQTFTVGWGVFWPEHKETLH